MPHPSLIEHSQGLSFNAMLSGFASHFLSAAVPASRNEYQSIRLQLESETFPSDRYGDKPRSFHSLPPHEQAQLEKKRLQGKCITLQFSFVRIADVHILNNAHQIFL
jgi:hypothetical protein